MNIDRYLKLFDTTSEYEQYVGGGVWKYQT